MSSDSDTTISNEPENDSSKNISIGSEIESSIDTSETSNQESIKKKKTKRKLKRKPKKHKKKTKPKDKHKKKNTKNEIDTEEDKKEQTDKTEVSDYGDTEDETEDESPSENGNKKKKTKKHHKKNKHKKKDKNKNKKKKKKPKKSKRRSSGTSGSEIVSGKDANSGGDSESDHFESEKKKDKKKKKKKKKKKQKQKTKKSHSKKDKHKDKKIESSIDTSETSNQESIKKKKTKRKLKRKPKKHKKKTKPKDKHKKKKTKNQIDTEEDKKEQTDKTEVSDYGDTEDETEDESPSENGNKKKKTKKHHKKDKHKKKDKNKNKKKKKKKKPKKSKRRSSGTSGSEIVSGKDANSGGDSESDHFESEKKKDKKKKKKKQKQNTKKSHSKKDKHKDKKIKRDKHKPKEKHKNKQKQKHKDKHHKKDKHKKKDKHHKKDKHKNKEKDKKKHKTRKKKSRKEDQDSSDNSSDYQEEYFKGEKSSGFENDDEINEEMLNSDNFEDEVDQGLIYLINNEIRPKPISLEIQKIRYYFILEYNSNQNENYRLKFLFEQIKKVHKQLIYKNKNQNVKFLIYKYSKDHLEKSLLTSRLKLIEPFCHQPITKSAHNRKERFSNRSQRTENDLYTTLKNFKIDILDRKTNKDKYKEREIQKDIIIHWSTKANDKEVGFEEKRSIEELIDLNFEFHFFDLSNLKNKNLDIRKDLINIYNQYSLQEKTDHFYYHGISQKNFQSKLLSILNIQKTGVVYKGPNYFHQGYNKHNIYNVFLNAISTKLILFKLKNVYNFDDLMIDFLQESTKSRCLLDCIAFLSFYKHKRNIYKKFILNYKESDAVELKRVISNRGDIRTLIEIFQNIKSFKINCDNNYFNTGFLNWKKIKNAYQYGIGLVNDLEKFNYHLTFDKSENNTLFSPLLLRYHKRINNNLDNFAVLYDCKFDEIIYLTTNTRELVFVSKTSSYYIHNDKPQYVFYLDLVHKDPRDLKKKYIIDLMEIDPVILSNDQKCLLEETERELQNMHSFTNHGIGVNISTVLLTKILKRGSRLINEFQTKHNCLIFVEPERYTSTVIYYNKTSKSNAIVNLKKAFTGFLMDIKNGIQNKKEFVRINYSTQIYICKGLYLEDLIIDQETKKIFFFDLHMDFNKQIIIKYFKRVGDIERIKIKLNSDGLIDGWIFYKTTKAAENAIKYFNGQEFKITNEKTESQNIINKKKKSKLILTTNKCRWIKNKNERVVANLFWNEGKPMGMAKILFNTLENRNKALKEQLWTRMGNGGYKITTKNTESENLKNITFKNVPKEIDNIDLFQKFTYYGLSKIVMPRKGHIKKNYDQFINTLKRDITMIDPNLKIKSVNLPSNEIDPNKAFFINGKFGGQIEMVFSNLKKLFQTIAFFKKKQTFNFKNTKYKIHLLPPFEFNQKIRTPLYNSLGPILEDYKKEQCKIACKRVGTKYVNLKVYHPDPNIILRKRFELVNILKGKEFHFIDPHIMQYFFYQSGVKILKKISLESGTKIEYNGLKNCLMIYGNDGQIQKASNLIRLKTENLIISNLTILPQDFEKFLKHSNSIKKYICTEAGIDLLTFTQSKNNSDQAETEIQLWGARKNIENAEALFQQIFPQSFGYKWRAEEILNEKKNNQQKDKQQQQEQVFMCNICYVPYPNIRDQIVLDGCNHQFCKNCLLQCIKHIAKPPIICGFQKCKSPNLCIKELKMFLPEIDFIKFSEKAIINYQDRNKYFTCTTLGCELLYLKSDRPEEHHCIGCGVSYCRKCGDIWHIGPTCLEKKDLEKTMELLKDYRRCPNCGNGVHKYTGCNKVTCSCGKSMCWACPKDNMKCFDTKNQCYAHLTKVHGGYF
ncbi:splicing factor 3b subunit [Anaeramoeba flamelloides]|uniref:Splicing factor 3b subunit n=1 Tax=Anaeramoeba flamelloides TaxID=1746091 RepID=A0AAV7YKS6_9EUKA|nr:splicing factor 3b subunit [Anaeramoeba flamelloides]